MNIQSNLTRREILNKNKSLRDATTSIFFIIKVIHMRKKISAKTEKNFRFASSYIVYI